MTIIDPKTSKRFVTGMLKSENSRMGDCIKEMKANQLKEIKENKRPSDKPSAMAKRLEDNYKKKLGDTYLYSYWKGRLFSAFSLMVVTPDDRPPYVELVVHSINIRSDVQKFYTLATISTHSMERMLERRSNPKLLPLLKEEISIAFLNRYLVLLSDFEDGKLEGNEFKVNTATGIMCIRIPEENYPPVFTTWYPQ